MRGVAALLVALFHFGIYYGINVANGYLAVDFFFALSGFVIALNYTDRLGNGLSLAKFVALRLIRLYPLYALGLGLGCSIVLVLRTRFPSFNMYTDHLSTRMALGVLMLPAPYDPMFRFNSQSWSLFCEMLVNILFAALLFKARTVIIASVVAGSAIVLVCTIGPPYFMNVGWAWSNFIPGLARATFSFGVGILMFRHMPYRKARASALALVPVLSLVGIICFEVSADIRSIWQLFVISALFPVVLAAGIMLDVPPSLRRAFSFLGDISFPVYMIHYPLSTVLAPAARALHLGGLVSCAAFLVVTTAAALVSLRFFDTPVRARLNRWLFASRPDQAGLTPEVQVPHHGAEMVTSDIEIPVETGSTADAAAIKA